MSHRIQKDWKAKLKSAVPFGLGQAKPKHFRDIASIAWRNRTPELVTIFSISM